MGLDMRGWGMGGWEGGEARGALGDGCMEVGEVGMGCGLGMPRVAPAPHSEAGPGFWLLGKAAGGGVSLERGGESGWAEGGTRRAGGFGKRGFGGIGLAFSRLFLFSSRLLISSIFWGGGGFFLVYRRPVGRSTDSCYIPGTSSPNRRKQKVGGGGGGVEADHRRQK